MKSSRSLFNKTVFLSDIKRFLPFAILFAVIECIIFPLIVYTQFERKVTEFDDFIGINIASEVFAALFALVFAVTVFSYLFSPNKCNALHAFPIGRKALYITHLFSGYVLLIVPQLLAFALAIPGIMILKLEVGPVILFQAASIFLFSLISYSVGVLAVMLSGHAFAAVALYFILQNLHAGLYVIKSTLESGLVLGYTNTMDSEERLHVWCSPVIQLFSEKLFSGNRGNGYYLILGIYAAVALLLLVLSWFLYKRRQLECAGEMTAFSAEIPVLRVIISIVGSTLIALFISTILELGVIGFTVLFAFNSFLLYFAAQMILKKKFNVFRPSMFLGWLICCVLSIGAVIGLVTFESTYVPAASSIKTVTVDAAYSMDLTDSKEIEAAASIHRSLIDYTVSTRGRFNNNSTWYGNMIMDGIDYSDELTLEYQLKNGRTVTRSYRYKLDDDAINRQITTLEQQHPYINMLEELDRYGIDFTITSIELTTYDDGDLFANTEDFDVIYRQCRKEVEKLTKDYSYNKLKTYLQRNDYLFDSEAVSVNFTCKLDSHADAATLKALKKLSERGYYEGNISYYDYDEEDENGRISVNKTFEIYIGNLQKGTKVTQYFHRSE